jgi:molybdate transport system substrate-binding protein
MTIFGRTIRPAVARMVLATAALAWPLCAVSAELLVSAASSLTNALRDIAPAFEAAMPGTKLEFNFAATDILLTQIAKGAPVDVFVAADDDAMSRAEREGLLLPGSRRDIAGNRLVLIVPAGAATVTALDALAAPRFRRIAVGRYAKAALDQAQLWTPLTPKFVFAANVRQALDYVARSEADAGFVYATDALLMPDKVTVTFAVATPTPIRYPAAVIGASRNAALAQAFVAYLDTAPAQQVLARYGFARP